MARIITLIAQLHATSISRLLRTPYHADVATHLIGATIEGCRVVSASVAQIVPTGIAGEGMWYGNHISVAIECPSDFDPYEWMDRIDLEGDKMYAFTDTDMLSVLCITGDTDKAVRHSALHPVTIAQESGGGVHVA